MSNTEIQPATRVTTKPITAHVVPTADVPNQKSAWRSEFGRLSFLRHNRRRNIGAALPPFGRQPAFLLPLQRKCKILRALSLHGVSPLVHNVQKETDMKKLLILSLAAMIAASVVYAEAPQGQCPKGKGPQAGQRMQKGPRGLLPTPVLEKLNLTAEQKAKYDELDAACKKDEAANTDRSKAREIHKGYVEQLKSVLTDEQKKTLEEMRPKHPPGEGKGGHKGGQGGRPVLPPQQ